MNLQFIVPSSGLPDTSSTTSKMTFRAVEDRPTPKEVYNKRLYFECSVIAMGSLL